MITIELRITPSAIKEKKTGLDISDCVLELFQNRMSGMTLFVYMEQQVKRLRNNGQHRTAETYQTTLNSFRSFRKGEDIGLSTITTDILLQYESYLRLKGLAMNTVSFYMRRLRAVYNRAVEEGLTKNRYPFKRVFTSSEKTVKRAVPLSLIKKLKDLDLAGMPSKSFARDMFLFSFYTRGMSFIDIAYLQKNDLKGDTLVYRRRKTGQMLTIRWESCMEQIAATYAAPPHSAYLFSIIDESSGDIRKQYHKVLTLINRQLKEIGNELGFPLPLTMYVARHSWASIAHEKGIPLAVISEGMGHDSERTTQIYLASLETQVIDRANQKILSLL